MWSEVSDRFGVSVWAVAGDTWARETNRALNMLHVINGLECALIYYHFPANNHDAVQLSDGNPMFGVFVCS